MPSEVPRKTQLSRSAGLRRLPSAVSFATSSRFAGAAVCANAATARPRMTPGAAVSAAIPNAVFIPMPPMWLWRHLRQLRGHIPDDATEIAVAAMDYDNGRIAGAMTQEGSGYGQARV